MRETIAQGQPRRLLFCSWHCVLDTSSGAAVATRDLLALLTGRGWQCQVLCGPHLDFEEGASVLGLVSEQRLAYTTSSCPVGPAPFVLFHALLGDTAVKVFVPPVFHRYCPPSVSVPEPSPDNGEAFLALLDRLLERSRPDLLLTYGGDWLTEEIMARARRRGLPVVFALHNFEYQSVGPFRGADAILVPSEFAREHYRRTLGLESTAIPSSMDWARLQFPEVEGRYVTFVNPQPHKGVLVFARIAHELGKCRPDIPLLVVEGRARADWLQAASLDFRGLKNLHRMPHTPDPRAFYRVSRLVLMPSLGNESFGRVTAEALLNGIPVLASRRGALPEVLAEAGFLFDIPARYTPATRAVPSAEEIAPWVETIIQLWDDATAYEAERRRCRVAAQAWRPERLIGRYEEFLNGVWRPVIPGAETSALTP